MIKKALFIQKNGTIGGAIVDISEHNNRKNIGIYTYNDKGSITGRATINQIHNDEYYIYDIYCYTLFRNNGIGTAILRIIESIIEPNVTIAGIFLPYCDKDDRVKGRIVEHEKLFLDTRKFYISSGYSFYESHGIEKFEKRVVFKENNFASINNVLYDTKLYDYDIKPSDQLIKKLSLR